MFTLDEQGQSYLFFSNKTILDILKYKSSIPICINMIDNLLFSDPVLRFLLAGLQNQPLASISANSLESICSMCRDQMGGHFAGLVEIIQALDTFSLTNEAAIGLLKGAAMVLAKMPHDKVTEGLKQLCSPQIEHLSKVGSFE